MSISSISSIPSILSISPILTACLLLAVASAYGAPKLVVTEVHFNPAEPAAGSPYDNDDFEFIELANADSIQISLLGVRFVSGVTFDFSTGAVGSLGAGQRVVVVRNRVAFESRYGGAAASIAGEYAGGLNNAGELLRLETNLAERIAHFTYNDARGWPVATDGAGHSLVPVSEARARESEGSLDYGGAWRASAYIGGSPGAPDPDPPSGVVINEIVAHSDLNDPAYPLYDSNDWIELFNPTRSAIDLGGWYLSDRSDELTTWPIPSVVVPPFGRVTFDEITGFHSPITAGFGLNKAGERLFLSHFPGTPGRDRVADAIRFKGQENDVSLGRIGDGGADWGALAPTRDRANTSPPRRVVVSEIMYHPPPTATYPVDNAADEFIELFNPTAESVPLWNAAGFWRIDGGVSYTFPPNTSIAPGGRLLLLNLSPDNPTSLSVFLQAYALGSPPAAMLGPYVGSLSDRGERVALERPQAPDTIGDPVSWVIVDEAIYFDREPWLTGPDGSGTSLQRFSGILSGNAPGNWRDCQPTPGAPPTASCPRPYGEWVVY